MFFNESVTRDVVGSDIMDNVDAVVESMIYADLIQQPVEKIQQFCESAEAQALLERSVLNKKTLVRLSKKDDYARRLKQCAYQLARDKKDPLWAKLVKTQMMKRKLVAQIMKKYQAPATRLAKASQIEYIKTAKKSNFIGQSSLK